MIQDRVPRVPLPAPRIMQGKLCPLGARGRRDVAHLAYDFLRSVLAAKRCSLRWSLGPLCSLRWRDCTSNSRGLGAEFSGTFRRSLRTTFSGHPSNPLSTETTLYTFSLQAISLTVGAPAFNRLDPNPNYVPDLDFRAGHLVLGPRSMLRRAISAISGLEQARFGATCVVACFLPLIWLKMSASMRCHCPRRPAPAAMRRNMASLMVRMMRSAK